MRVVAWNNGRHHRTGAGYGLKVSAKDRDDYFDKSWGEVLINLPDGSIATVNITKDSFWSSTCRELIGKNIGGWLLASGLAPWGSGNPPRFDLKVIRPREFRLHTLESQ